MTDRRPTAEDEPAAKKRAPEPLGDDVREMMDDARTAERAAAERARGGTVVWVDGCFDMFHFGHANMLRQAKQLGTFLIAGVHSDADIRVHKGPPVMDERERYEAVAACKWADAVVCDAPYVTQVDVIDKFHVSFVVHGDDVVVSSNGSDCYAAVKAAGRFQTVPRTNAVSTTDLVGRMLLMTDAHMRNREGDADLQHSMSAGANAKSPYTSMSKFVASTQKIMQFASARERKPSDVVVYTSGSFDLFHVGHSGMLREARRLGTYLIVGVNDDDVLRDKRGRHPIMSLHERVLSVLQCRYVDEVVIAAPYCVSESIIDSLGIHKVAHGTIDPPTEDNKPDSDGQYTAARQRDVLATIQSPHALTASDIMRRIIANRMKFEERNKKKEKREIEQIEQRKGTATTQE